MKHLVNINGQLVPADSSCLRVDNRAFRYGYSLFETMLFREGIVRLKDFHRERLLDGMTLLGISAGADFGETLEAELNRTIAENRAGDRSCRIRMQVYAGHGGLYDP